MSAEIDKKIYLDIIVQYFYLMEMRKAFIIHWNISGLVKLIIFCGIVKGDT